MFSFFAPPQLLLASIRRLRLETPQSHNSDRPEEGCQCSSSSSLQLGLAFASCRQQLQLCRICDNDRPDRPQQHWWLFAWVMRMFGSKPAKRRTGWLMDWATCPEHRVLFRREPNSGATTFESMMRRQTRRGSIRRGHAIKNTHHRPHPHTQHHRHRRGDESRRPAATAKRFRNGQQNWNHHEHHVGDEPSHEDECPLPPLCRLVMFVRHNHRRLPAAFDTFYHAMPVIDIDIDVVIDPLHGQRRQFSARR
jgi:hypothetical protein